MRRKFEVLPVAIAVALSFGLSGCGDKDEPNDNNHKDPEIVISQKAFLNIVEDKIWQITDRDETKYYKPDGVEYRPEEIEISGEGIKTGYYFEEGVLTEFTYISFGPVQDESMRKYRKEYKYSLNEQSGEITYTNLAGGIESLLFTIEKADEDTLTVRMTFDNIDQGGYKVCKLHPAKDAATWWKEYHPKDK